MIHLLPLTSCQSRKCRVTILYLKDRSQVLSITVSCIVGQVEPEILEAMWAPMTKTRGEPLQMETPPLCQAAPVMYYLCACACAGMFAPVRACMSRPLDNLGYCFFRAPTLILLRLSLGLALTDWAADWPVSPRDLSVSYSSACNTVAT